MTTSTGVAQVMTDAGLGYLKALGNPEGEHCLVSELVGTRLARWLGLSTLDWALVELGSDVEIAFPRGGAARAGTAFVTREEKRSQPWQGTSVELWHIENPEELSGIVVLDTWIRNCDRYRPCSFDGRVRRNVRNVLMSPRGASVGKFRVMAIDHTHAFTCGRQITREIGNIAAVKDPSVYGLFREFARWICKPAVEAYLGRLHHVTKSLAEEWTRVPEAWDLAQDARAALRDFILERAEFLAETLGGVLAKKLRWS